MISVILPFYKRFTMFERAAKANSFLQDQGTEVILVLDEPSDELQALRYASKHRHVKWRIIVNDNDHDWRPPCKAINVGIRHASGKHLAIFSPENIILLPTTTYLHGLASRFPHHLISARNYPLPEGVIQHPNGEFSVTPFDDACSFVLGATMSNMTFGFILIPRASAHGIHGWDESRIAHGGDDHDFHTRLELGGLKRVVDPFVFVVVVNHTRPDPPIGPYDNQQPATVAPLLNQAESWGTDFNRIAYDWKACT